MNTIFILMFGMSVANIKRKGKGKVVPVLIKLSTTP
jgi:hypothetical protein